MRNEAEHYFTDKKIRIPQGLLRKKTRKQLYSDSKY